jgi:hypothetical protein
MRHGSRLGSFYPLCGARSGPNTLNLARLLQRDPVPRCFGNASALARNQLRSVTPAPVTAGNPQGGSSQPNNGDGRRRRAARQAAAATGDSRRARASIAELPLDTTYRSKTDQCQQDQLVAAPLAQGTQPMPAPPRAPLPRCDWHKPPAGRSDRHAGATTSPSVAFSHQVCSGARRPSGPPASSRC